MQPSASLSDLFQKPKVKKQYQGTSLYSYFTCYTGNLSAPKKGTHLPLLQSSKKIKDFMGVFLPQ